VSLSVGDRLGRYEILGPLGAGGMGEVWKARDTELERVVAVKVLPESVAQDPERLERFQREARALAALSHPNLLDIYDVGSVDGLHYAVTELLEGDTLRQKVPTSGLPWQKVAEIGAAAADGLAAAHGKGIIHRDLKPENLFVTSDGRVKILDFGLAKVEDAFDPEGKTGTLTPAGTEAGTIMGTPGYMAPEQVKGTPADSRSDIFALGCVLYEMSAGKRAFGGDTGMEVMAAILKEEPPQLSSSGAKVPVDLERAVHRCLEKRPEARFQSAADLAYSLKHIGSSQAVPVMATPTPTAVTPITDKKRPWWQVAVAGALVVIATVIAWQALKPPGEQAPVEATVELDPNRIAVVPFVNRTADVTLDGLAARTADRLTQGLAELEELEVAPASAVSAAAGGAGTGALVRDVAKATSSGLVLTGVWDSVGDGLELQGTLQDAQTETIVHAFEPIPASRESPDEAIATLRDWTLMAVQDHLHPELAFAADDRFPKYEAYQAYRAWTGTMGMGGVQRFRTLELDPDFVRARLVMALGNAIVERNDVAEELLEPLELDDLTVEQAHVLEGIRMFLDSDWNAALEELTWVLEHGHDSYFARVVLINTADNAHRHELVLEHFEHLGRPTLELPMGVRTMPYLYAAIAYHLLGRHEEQLELARRVEAMTGPSPITRSHQAVALVGLGRLDELEPLVSEALTTESEGGGGGFLLSLAQELDAHGFRAESVEMADRAAEWWATTNLVDSATFCDFCYAVCLLSADRVEEALPIFQETAAADPSNPRRWFPVAIAAARLGDLAALEDATSRLEQLGALAPEDPEEWAEERANLAAWLGDRDGALKILREAVASGFHDWFGLHLRGLGPLTDDPEFQAIWKPKG